jgi:hypothetical protein
VKKQTIVSAVAAVATAAVLGVGGAALAQAGQTAPASVQADASPSAPATSGAPADQGRLRAPGLTKEKLKEFITNHGLTGDTAVKVTQAAVAKEPTAYLLRVGKVNDGTYRARMMRPDGTRIVLTIDANFTVTSVDNAPVKAPGQGRLGKGLQNGATPSASPTTSS